MATIRYACREDIPAILDLIKALADYEHELGAVQATEETLGNTIAFAAKPEPIVKDKALPETEATSASRPARCLLICPTPEAKPVGMALYFYNYSTWRAKPGIYLEDLFVLKEERGSGYGKQLLVTLAQEVVKMDGGRLEWSVLKWNEPSIKFYEAIGAKMMSEWVGMRVDGDALNKLAGGLE